MCRCRSDLGHPLSWMGLPARNETHEQVQHQYRAAGRRPWPGRRAADPVRSYPRGRRRLRPRRQERAACGSTPGSHSRRRSPRADRPRSPGGQPARTGRPPAPPTGCPDC
jgi:hypothetical protein